ncbi:hypothetical protein BBO_03380 [Beauveria brongniartii RCEF 3172]|uniref:Uncharacterized protein n=1 Tax=Beauveria brongniartii RCEF 3172 TaxID=1081107 RepID=A0A167FTQ8_9HYPO|nr:hypothetical protein BBO_03380 [Beauveria brongniartii RCEF 3172]
MPVLPRPREATFQASSLLPPAVVSAAVVAPRVPQDAPGFQAIPTTYHTSDSAPAPGAIAGIVLGSVGAFLLLIALLFSCTGWTPVFLPWQRQRAVVVEEEHHRHRRRSHKPSHRRRHEHRRRGGGGGVVSVDATEMYEVRAAAAAAPPPPHRAPSSRRSSRPAQMPMAPQPLPLMTPAVRVSQTHTRRGGARHPPPPPPAVVRDDTTETDLTEDEVVVIEEHSPPRNKSRRSSGRKSHDSRRDSRRYDRG